MKRTYYIPQISVVEVKTAGMLAVSTNGNVTFDGKGGGSISTQDAGAVSSGMARGGFFDDDED